ncbi:YtpR family tRNA-binding protein [Alkalicoccobacillus porphyridii]|uniref:DUF4479 domain-containing protein n=1 Tax=Alkalicoccobacillus porphyridii TaxID=2597270 RepID=A0A554A322_9BACI|nr:DUF4479 family protein [Alkalicoccobacillus porphyridii]TSB48094.1 DUF4479 domain-containing protein [Alkalicoccobacillus porphyridii]
MNIFYNLKGIGDTLLISLSPVEIEEKAFERKGNVARIYSADTNETIGYNIFNASSYGDIQGAGNLEQTDSLIKMVQDVLSREGFDVNLSENAQPAFVVGHVTAKEKHPNADKLNICQVDVGSTSLQIVCGAPNVEANQKVVVALEGAVMPSGLIIKKAQLRGVESNGMICSAKELNLPNASEEKGILVLEASAKVGESFTINKTA